MSTNNTCSTRAPFASSSWAASCRDRCSSWATAFVRTAISSFACRRSSSTCQKGGSTTQGHSQTSVGIPNTEICGSIQYHPRPKFKPTGCHIRRYLGKSAAQKKTSKSGRTLPLNGPIFVPDPDPLPINRHPPTNESCPKMGALSRCCRTKS